MRQMVVRGKKRFKKDEFLTPKQIGNFFSSEAQKRKKITEEEHQALQYYKKMKQFRDTLGKK